MSVSHLTSYLHLQIILPEFLAGEANYKKLCVSNFAVHGYDQLSQVGQTPQHDLQLYGTGAVFFTFLSLL